MAETFATEVAGLNATPITKSNGAVHGGRLRRFRATIALASQASGDTIVLADLPAGYAVAYGVLISSASLGTATLAVGISGTAGKYRAAATFTATDTPTMFGIATALDDAPLTATERVIATVGTAALPSSGTLVVDLYVSGA